VPQHVWSSVSNPVTYTDANPVGTGPYMLQTYSSHGFLLKQNPNYWNKSQVKVSAVDFPFYSTNANLVPPIASGQIDWAGSNLGPGISSSYLSKSNDNTRGSTTSLTRRQQRGHPVVQRHQGAAERPAVRQAVSLGINRQQLSTQRRIRLRGPATSSGGLLLPIDNAFLDPSVQGDLPATGDPAKVVQHLTKDGYTKVGGKWTKNGKQITFSITDPIPYSTTTPTTSSSRASSTSSAST
jgi:peptide/nickel transport system substrate-binding protein